MNTVLRVLFSGLVFTGFAGVLIFCPPIGAITVLALGLYLCVTGVARK